MARQSVTMPSTYLVDALDALDAVHATLRAYREAGDRLAAALMEEGHSADPDGVYDDDGCARCDSLTVWHSLTQETEG
jgi:hypothetical protein